MSINLSGRETRGRPRKIDPNVQEEERRKREEASLQKLRDIIKEEIAEEGKDLKPRGEVVTLDGEIDADIYIQHRSQKITIQVLDEMEKTINAGRRISFKDTLDMLKTVHKIYTTPVPPKILAPREDGLQEPPRSLQIEIVDGSSS